MSKIKDSIYVGCLTEYPERIEEFFIFEFKERDVNYTVDRVTFIDKQNNGVFDIFLHVSYVEDDEPLEDIIRKVFTNYKMELGIANNTGWRF